MKEIWKPVPEYEGLYEVSNYGRVKKVSTGKLLTQYNPKNDRDYYYVGLNKDGKRSNKFVHRLVAMAFIPNPDNKPEVDHIDRDSLNNFANNLRWATREENIANRASKVFDDNPIVEESDWSLPYLRITSDTAWINPYAWNKKNI